MIEILKFLDLSSIIPHQYNLLLSLISQFPPHLCEHVQLVLYASPWKAVQLINLKDENNVH